QTSADRSRRNNWLETVKAEWGKIATEEIGILGSYYDVPPDDLLEQWQFTSDGRVLRGSMDNMEFTLRYSAWLCLRIKAKFKPELKTLYLTIPRRKLDRIKKEEADAAKAIEEIRQSAYNKSEEHTS